MFRRIGLSWLIVSMCSLLQGATLFAGITNGTFDSTDPDEGWHYQWYSNNGEFGDHITQAGSSGALMQGFDESFTDLFQSFSAEPGSGYLQFDLRFEFGNLSETEYFTACILEPSAVPDMDGHFIPSNALEYYSINTKATDREDVSSSDVHIQMIGGDYSYDSITKQYFSIRNIQIPVVPGDYKIWFGLTGWDPDVSATAIINNVTLTAVPEPATMTLGLIGVAVVGAARRRKS